MLHQSETQPVSNSDSPLDWGHAILGELQKAHTQVIASIRDLAKTTAKPGADRIEYASVRFRLSKASLARRIVVRAACDYLLQDATPSDRQTISRLRSADSDLARQASQHVNRWTADQVSLEWDAYCSASREIQRALLKQIEFERVMLYPLLREQESCPPGPPIRMIPIDQFLSEEAAAA